jgi:pre-mRNA-splicing helicase BRR2
MTPLRQFKGVPPEILRKAEGKQFVSFGQSLLEYSSYITTQPWYRYFDLVCLYR